MFNYKPFKNEYEYYLARVRDRYNNCRLIDHEADTYMVYEDKENKWLWSMWFDNGRLIHEADCPV